MNTQPSYIGRFAPSPTGELHQGSLLSAVASYLDARQHSGLWLVRMEDLDPPREQAGAANHILQTLQAHQLHWDGPVMYQSQRLGVYREHLQRLIEQDLTYPCNCTRARLKHLDAYDGFCREHAPASDTGPCAVRVKVPQPPNDHIAFNDLFQGPQSQQLSNDVGDFVVLRKDGLFAYQLAVVVDDIGQGITHILRGSDLLDSSARQRYLFQLFAQTPPVMGHVPVIVNEHGQKLSKQTFAQPLDEQRANENLYQTLQRLGLQPPQSLQTQDCKTLLDWGVEHWDRSLVPRVLALNPPDIGNLAAT